MALYQYIARDFTGMQVKGILHGDAEHDILVWLRDRQYTPVSIEQVQTKERKRRMPQRKPISAEDIGSLCWQLCTMIEGGVPITDALDTIAADTDNRRLQKVLKEVSGAMRTGESFHDSLARHPRVFDHLFCAMIHAGESGGTLATVLKRLAEFHDRRDEIARKVKRAMAYPAFVLGFVCLVIVALMLFVIPRFESIFADLGSRMPAFTKAFMAVYHVIMDNAPLVLGSGAGLVLLLLLFGRTAPGARFYSGVVLRLPLFGAIYRFAFLSMYGRTLATLLDSGVSVLDAHEILARFTRNRRIQQAIAQTTEQITQGVGIATSMVASGFFPPLMTKMVQVGEDSGSLPAVLDRVSGYFEKKVDITVGALIAVMEPALITVVGAIVLVVLIALYLPVFAMSDIGSAGVS